MTTRTHTPECLALQSQRHPESTDSFACECPERSAEALKPKEPQRRIVLRAKIEADSWPDLYGHLRSLVTEMAMKKDYRINSSVSGGYSTGHIVVVSEDETMTHDKWALDLDAWLEANRPRAS